MAIVAGVDFGTLSVRVTLVDSKKGPIGTASASYELHRGTMILTTPHNRTPTRWPRWWRQQRMRLNRLA